MYDNALLTTVCGSRSFDLATTESDKDYLTIVSPKDYPDISTDRCTKHSNTDVDWFAHRIDAFRNIEYCASMLIVPYYGNVTEGSCDELRTFWAQHAVELMDIAPKFTWNSTLRDINWYLDNKAERSYHVAVRHMAVLACRYETGSMREAIKLNDLWRARYEAIKLGAFGLTELRMWHDELMDERIQKYFEEQLDNKELHAEYVALIDRIIGNE